MIQKTLTVATTGAITATWEVPRAGLFTTALIAFNQAPGTTANINFTYKSAAGTNYDVIVHTINPASPATTEIHWSPSAAIPLLKGDKIEVTYSNPNNRRVNITLLGLDRSSF